ADGANTIGAETEDLRVGGRRFARAGIVGRGDLFGTDDFGGRKVSLQFVLSASRRRRGDRLGREDRGATQGDQEKCKSEKDRKSSGHLLLLSEWNVAIKKPMSIERNKCGCRAGRITSLLSPNQEAV